MFEKREVNRSASPEEKADLINRLLEVLSSIDTTQEEAKAIAADYRSIVGDLRKREIGLRFNLQTGTVTQEVDVKKMINEPTGMTEYFDHNGIEVTELRHETSLADREKNALQNQIDMFGIESNKQQVDKFSPADDTVHGLPVGDLTDTSPASNTMVNSQILADATQEQMPDTTVTVNGKSVKKKSKQEPITA